MPSLIKNTITKLISDDIFAFVKAATKSGVVKDIDVAIRNYADSLATVLYKYSYSILNKNIIIDVRLNLPLPIKIYDNFCFFAIDTGEIFFCNGSQWILANSGSITNIYNYYNTDSDSDSDSDSSTSIIEIVNETPGGEDIRTGGINYTLLYSYILRSTKVYYNGSRLTIDVDYDEVLGGIKLNFVPTTDTTNTLIIDYKTIL